MECLFCKIVAGTVETKLVYSDEEIMGFLDIDPQAPHHILFVPRKHIATLNDVSEADTLLLGKLVQAAQRYAHTLQIADRGYRLLLNCNRDGGQAIYHIHLHLLGGRAMNWPPG